MLSGLNARPLGFCAAVLSQDSRKGRGSGGAACFQQEKKPASYAVKRGFMRKFVETHWVSQERRSAKAKKRDGMWRSRR